MSDKVIRKEFTHYGNPCIHCGTPHDAVEKGECPALLGEPKRATRDRDYSEALEGIREVLSDQGIDKAIHTAETAPEAHYYEIAKLMADFMTAIQCHSGAYSFLDSHCEALCEQFEKVLKEVQDRSPDLFLE